MNIAEHGSRKGVIDHIEGLAPAEQADKKVAALESAQLAAVKLYLISGINALDEGFNGVRVHAEFGAAFASNNFTANVIGMKLKL